MPRLILHIGTHKTATTSIQHHFFKHRDALAGRGLFYPGYDLIGKKPHYAHLGMVNALAGQHKNYSREDARRFFRAVRERQGDYDTTLISAEPLYRHATGQGPGSAPEAYWPARMQFIEEIHDLLGAAEVVVVFRRQADYAQSLYQEHLKVTQYDRSFPAFLADFWFHFAFLDQARAWDSVFPGLRALSFEKLIGTGDAVAEFARLLDLPVQGLPPAVRHNEAMATDMVILKRILQAVTSKDEALQRVEQLQDRLDPGLLAGLEPRSFFADAEARLAFQASFAADNAALKSFMAQGHAEDEPCFPATFKAGGQFGDSPHPKVMAKLLRLATHQPVPDQPTSAPVSAVLRSARQAGGIPLELTVLGDEHAKFFFHDKDVPMARSGFQGSRLKITDHGMPAAALTALPQLLAPEALPLALQTAASKATFLCLGFGQIDLELGYYARALHDSETLPARQDFVAGLLEQYTALVSGLDFDTDALLLKGVNLTLLRDRNFSLRYLRRALNAQSTSQKAAIEAVLASETEQNAMALAFNAGLRDFARQKGIGYFDLNMALAAPQASGAPARLADVFRPASPGATLANTIEVRRLHIRHLLQGFGANSADYSV